MYTATQRHLRGTLAIEKPTPLSWVCGVLSLCASLSQSLGLTLAGPEALFCSVVKEQTLPEKRCPWHLPAHADTTTELTPQFLTRLF